MFRLLLRWAACLLLITLASCKESTLSLLPLPQGTAGAAATIDPNGPLSAWTFDSDARDSAGDNHGSLVNGASFEDDPVRGGVLSCSGLDVGVVVANETSLDFSYALWIWTNVASATGETAIDGSAILWSNVTGLEDDFTLALLNDKLSYMSYSQPSTGTRMLVDGVWHHIALTRRDGERVALYVDGEVDGDGNSGTGLVLGNPSIHLCGNPEQQRYFVGKLDDLRYYPRVLSSGEVQELFETTALP